jgi:hypothetical protein
VKPTASPAAILLVDASASVTHDFVRGKSIYKRFAEIADALPHKQLRVLFWNSDNENNVNFPKGHIRAPFLVDTSTKLEQSFGVAIMRIGCRCATMPHIAFSHIDDWLDAGFSNVVYLLTDGEIGWDSITPKELTDLKTRLSSTLKQMLDKHPDVQLHIVAVENKRRDFDQVEGLVGAAGCDVYQTLNDHNLTRHIARFVSYTPNTDQTTGHVHINRTRAPPGFVPFQDSYFSPLHARKFARHVWNLIQAKSSDADGLLRLLQDLSVSLSALCEGKSTAQRGHVVEEFSRMFAGTAVDEVIVAFMLDSALKDEFNGNAALFANHRARLKNLYQQADEVLHRSVRSALGVSAASAFVGPPIQGKIIVGPAAELCNQPIYPSGGKNKNVPFEQAGHLIDGQVVPILLPLGYRAPLADDENVKMSEQCARQWVRQIISNAHHLHPTSSQVMYYALGLALQTVLSPQLEAQVKDTYRQMGCLILRKKRNNSTSSELSAIRNGSLLPSRAATMSCSRR